jgi:hypothetical protein
MIAAMQQTIRDHHLPERRVWFMHADVLGCDGGDALRAPGPHGLPYDAVASHFFLDCFRPEQLALLATEVGRCTAPGARWLVSDFRVPEFGWRRIRARLILAGLYAFFNVVTGLPAGELTKPDPLIQEAGFELKRRRCFNFGLLHSDVWQQS